MVAGRGVTGRVRPRARVQETPPDASSPGEPRRLLAVRDHRAGRIRERCQQSKTPARLSGIVRVAVDGQHLGHDINLYSGRVCPSGSIDLAAMELTAGRHDLRFTSVGKDPASANTRFGVDAVT